MYQAIFTFIFKFFLLQISKIERLNHLCELRVLNLAGNSIHLVENLSGLESLAELNLRRNKISAVVSHNMDHKRKHKHEHNKRNIEKQNARKRHAAYRLTVSQIISES